MKFGLRLHESQTISILPSVPSWKSWNIGPHYANLLNENMGYFCCVKAVKVLLWLIISVQYCYFQISYFEDVGAMTLPYLDMFVRKNNLQTVSEVLERTSDWRLVYKRIRFKYILDWFVHSSYCLLLQAIHRFSFIPCFIFLVFSSNEPSFAHISNSLRYRSQISMLTGD